MSLHISRMPCLVVIVLLCATASPALPAGEIKWKSGAVLPPPQAAPEVSAALTRIAERGESQHVVVQFADAVTPAQRVVLEEAGVELLSYVGSNAYFARVSPSSDTNAASRAAPLAWVGDVALDWKLHPVLARHEVPEWAVVDAARSDNPTVAAYLLFHRDVPLDATALQLAESHGAFVVDVLETVNGLVIELPLDNVAALAAEDAVQWIEPPLPQFSPVNNSIRTLVGADTVQAPPYSLYGSGVTVLVYDAGEADATHPDFGGRLSVRDASSPHNHPTHVSGTIGGDGTMSSGLYRGMAPGVTIEQYTFEVVGGLQEGFLYTDPGDIEQDYGEAINVYGAHIANNSIGSNVESNNFDCVMQGDYGVTDSIIDAIVRGSLSGGEPFRIVWGAGNERQGDRCDVEGYGDYYSIAPPVGAKNHISVGAVNSNDDSMTSFSSWGPTDDGRLKPDICAPGCQSNDDNTVTSTFGGGGYGGYCGTSMACPTVVGMSSLLLEDYRVHYPGQPDFRNSTLKVLLAQNAVDLGNPGPDYQFGYGSVRIQPTIDFMRQGNFMEAEVGHGGTYLALVEVQPGDPPLKITLAWDDAPGTPNASPALVNDLDLVVYSPSTAVAGDCDGDGDVDGNDFNQFADCLAGPEATPPGGCECADRDGDDDVDVADFAAFALNFGNTSGVGERAYPWTLDPLNPSAPAVRTQGDQVNNIEQVVVDTPEAGLWRVEIHGFNVPEGPQPFSLCTSSLLINSSSTGVVSLNRGAYACTDTVGVKVVDTDLNADDEVIETVLVTVSSDSEAGGEAVLLTETGPLTATFEGQIAISTAGGTGVLTVAHGDTVTATYIDADDGLGGVNVVVEATGTVDCVPPQVSNVQVVSVGTNTATLSFETDEPARGVVHYGTACGSYVGSTDPGGLTLVHTVNITGLDDGTLYYVAVEAEDAVGNAGWDDNGGQCYPFGTEAIFYEFTLDSDPGWSREGNWEFGPPNGSGSIARDPATAYTGVNIFGYQMDDLWRYEANMDPTYLTTSALDFTGHTGVSLSFWRWLSIAGAPDDATIEVSRNGTDWTTVWSAVDQWGSNNNWESWTHVTHDISSIADDQPTVYVRWGMGPTDDSTEYGGWNIDDIQFASNGGRLAITLPNGLPDLVPAGTPVTVDVKIFGGYETIVPGTALLHYRYDGGSFLTNPLTHIGGDFYEATLPAPWCTDEPEYYFSAEGSLMGTVYSPVDAPTEVYAIPLIGQYVTVLEDDFETDTGWTVGSPDDDATQGIWERADPFASPLEAGQTQLPQPEDDHTPAAGTMCFVTGRGSAGGAAGADDVGVTQSGTRTTTLTSPTLDFSGAQSAYIRYWRWLYSNGSPFGNNLTFTVKISNNNGASWVTVETVSGSLATGWEFKEIVVPNYVTPTSQVKLRFVTTNNDHDWPDAGWFSTVETLIDDVTAVRFQCP